ncbi:DUF1365 domain-containing protein [Afifella sp. IM 167]|uniref:DUF1365 domain-containing protein n=1 Tax=Afifella sp. IM 167 TaxID=2033586 RepID=UPI001CC9F23D|nr:DUF1365 domain-containing protein [Afifella sp. IM 167]MBZ8131922.1 DUF1365 domain-containing protein [Afifella sp. IM 167]
MKHASALYAGKVVHSRLKPRRHRLSYRVFSLLLDLDELPELDRKLRLFGHNRRAAISFLDRDHGNGRPGELRAWVDANLAEAGIEGGGPVRVLAYPRLFGFVFNPLTVYFCHAASGRLSGILYEVSNTFGERRTYVIPVEEGAGPAIEQECDKLLYVSPFIPMECHYRFRIEPPGERVTIRIGEEDAEGPLLVAAFSGERREMRDGVLMRALFGYPLMTLKVIGAIHFEALRLWWKGVPVFRHLPAAERIATTIVTPVGAKSAGQGE